VCRPSFFRRDRHTSPTTQTPSARNQRPEAVLPDLVQLRQELVNSSICPIWPSEAAARTGPGSLVACRYRLPSESTSPQIRAQPTLEAHNFRVKVENLRRLRNCFRQPCSGAIRASHEFYAHCANQIPDCASMGISEDYRSTVLRLDRFTC
jgi:hypothetical protein